MRGVTTAVNIDGTALGLTVPGQTPGMGYAIAGADWQDCSGGTCGDTHEGGDRPGCLPPLSSGQLLEVVIVDAPVPNVDGQVESWVERGVFVRCLSTPTHTEPASG
ncbi:MAG: hypothetical protein U0Y82_12590 [Thermoleophilia bacterium]